MTRNTQTLEKAPVTLYGNVTISGTAGAPTLNALKSLGIKSISRTGTGKYAMTLGGPVGVDTYNRLLDIDITSLVSTTSAFTGYNVVSDASATTGIVTVQLVSAAGAAVDPANGEVLLIAMDLSNTSVNG